MPALSFLAFVGLALIAFLFYGNATLEPISPEIITTRHAVAPAPAPNMISQAVLAAQPAPDALKKIHPAARAARAEASHYRGWFRHQQQSQFDRFSIKGY